MGPCDVLTQFTVARAVHISEEDNLNELRRELREELGLVGGNFEKAIRFAQGSRLSGYTTVYVVTDFELREVDRDDNEIQEIVELPIRGLYTELLANHKVTADTLLVAKLLEEMF